jgi:hypothetical protein
VMEWGSWPLGLWCYSGSFSPGGNNHSSKTEKS